MPKKKNSPKIHCKYDKLVSIEKLVPNPKNPNTHPEKQIVLLSKVINNTGWRSPIVVSKRSGFIVRGHGRLEAAYVLECTEVPVDFQSYKNDAEEWADMIADNKLTELAEMDKELEIKLLKEIEALDYDMDMTGLDAADLEKMMDEKESQEVAGDIEFTEELLEEHNYIVLYFDNSIDWLQALSLFDIKNKKALHSKKGFEVIGVGRVLKGSDAINKITGG